MIDIKLSNNLDILRLTLTISGYFFHWNILTSQEIAKPLVSFVGLFGVILVLSYFSEKYIEKRFVKLGKEIVNKDRDKNKY